MGCGGSKEEPTAQPPPPVVLNTTAGAGAGPGPGTVDPSVPSWNVKAGEGAETASLKDAYANLLPEGEMAQVFKLFASMDNDKSGTLDVEELAVALKESHALRKRCACAAGFSNDASEAQVARAIIERADVNGDGQLQAAELELIIRGWAATDYEKMSHDEARQAAERNRLKGAAARAERNRIEAGGFAGLTDRVEALKIGEAAQAVQEAERHVFANEAGSEPAQAKAQQDPRVYDNLSPEERRQAAERNRLKGAAARAERNRVEAGGFAGLTNSAEALTIGEAAQAEPEAERRVYSESDPMAFPGGAHYVSNDDARAQRAEVDKDIRKAEMDECALANIPMLPQSKLNRPSLRHPRSYPCPLACFIHALRYLYKEQFKGLSAEDAMQIGEGVKLGGEVVDAQTDDDHKPKKKMPKALRKRMNKKTEGGGQAKEPSLNQV